MLPPASGTRGACAPRLAHAAVGLLGAFLLSGCILPTEFEGVYQEEVPEAGLPDERTHAVELTLFDFAGDTGGVIRFYRIGEANDRERPYLEATSCAYFGPRRVSRDSFSIRTTGPDGSELLVRVDADERGRRLLAEVVETGGIYAAPPDADAGSPVLVFERSSSLRADTECTAGCITTSGCLEEP